MALLFALGGTLQYAQDIWTGPIDQDGKAVYYKDPMDNLIATYTSFPYEPAFTVYSSEKDIKDRIHKGVVEVVELKEIWGMTAEELEKETIPFINESGHVVRQSSCGKRRIEAIALVSVNEDVPGSDIKDVSVIETIDISDKTDIPLDQIVLNIAIARIADTGTVTPEWALDYTKEHASLKNESLLRETAVLVK